MYVDTAPCRICGSEVDLRPHGEEPRSGTNPDGTLDERVCSNPRCPSNAEGRTETTPDP